MSKAVEHLSQQELETYLWGAAKLLRGLIDASDYKQYVFPLLFFKRLSDVWEEEYRVALDETRDTAYARATADDRFAIPEGAHWADVRSASRDVGRAFPNNRSPICLKRSTPAWSSSKDLKDELSLNSVVPSTKNWKKLWLTRSKPKRSNNSFSWLYPRPDEPDTSTCTARSGSGTFRTARCPTSSSSIRRSDSTLEGGCDDDPDVMLETARTLAQPEQFWKANSCLKGSGVHEHEAFAHP